MNILLNSRVNWIITLTLTSRNFRLIRTVIPIWNLNFGVIIQIQNFAGVTGWHLDFKFRAVNIGINQVNVDVGVLITGVVNIHIFVSIQVNIHRFHRLFGNNCVTIRLLRCIAWIYSDLFANIAVQLLIIQNFSGRWFTLLILTKIMDGHSIFNRITSVINIDDFVRILFHFHRWDYLIGNDCVTIDLLWLFVQVH
ncbi:hypothetical protein FD17_GL002216 [Lentilactobacillus sunkii DSM 19904]|uniref:Uncharacterized protein n=1 Tax=Lentilactobacillus sunkii DSM 19904 TaxID=1423808 RepID=A0A0R1KQR8_9LACO|nr:hypothetical protein FD17_GL002216 [Lentilactobacillus sunkii DSM 19904]